MLPTRAGSCIKAKRYSGLRHVGQFRKQRQLASAPAAANSAAAPSKTLPPRPRHASPTAAAAPPAAAAAPAVGFLLEDGTPVHLVFRKIFPPRTQ